MQQSNYKKGITNYELPHRKSVTGASFLYILARMTENITEHRKRIDDLDTKILKLIEERIQEAICIRNLKIDSGIPLFTPEREEELIQRLVTLANDQIPATVIREIWAAIIKGGKQTADQR